MLVLLLLGWGLTDVRQRARLDPADVSSHRTDVTVYTGAGAAFFAEGVDPYLVASPRGWHYLYPPLFALAMAPLAGLPESEQGVVFYVVSLLLLFGCLVETSRLVARATGRPHAGPLALFEGLVPRWLAWTALIAVLFPLLNCLQRAQLAPYTLYPLLLGTRLVLEDRSWARQLAGGVVLALPVAIKLTPLLPVACVGWVLWLRVFRPRKEADGAARARHAAMVTAGVLAGLLLWIFVLPAAVLGWKQNLAHLSTWVDRVAANREFDEENDFFGASRRNQSFQNAARLFSGSFHDEPASRAVLTAAAGRLRSEANASIPNEALDGGLRAARVAMVLLLVLLGGARLAASGTALDVAAALGLGAVGSVVFSPLSWGHHYGIIWPAVLFVPLLFLRAGRNRTAVALAASAAFLTVGHYAFIRQLGGIGMLGLGTAAWLVAAIVLLPRRAGRRDAG